MSFLLVFVNEIGCFRLSIKRNQLSN